MGDADHAGEGGMTLNVVQFPEHFAATDIPSALRVLADEIEAEKHGATHSLLWVVDAGGGQIKLGLMGKCSDSGLTAYFMAGAAQKKIMGGISDE